MSIIDKLLEIIRNEEDRRLYREQVNDYCYKKIMRVVHCKREEYDVYIGRPSKWGNPFTHIKDKKTKAEFVVDTREEAIAKYREWIQTQPQLLSSLGELKGKVLGCWCKPQACHGDVLLELIEKENENNIH